MFGSGRAILSLRDSYRSHLRQVRQATGFQYMRFHAIFHDEVGLYDEDPSGKPVYNFSYVNQIYDGLLQSGVRPFVELSFMPRKLAAQPTEHVFWYHPIISPPKDWDAWSNMITAFTQHLVARYGIDEVSQWYFEVWNEPNLDFWSGDPVSGAHPCGSISVSSDSHCQSTRLKISCARSVISVCAKCALQVSTPQSRMAVSIEEISDSHSRSPVLILAQ